jgi:hypothetical protein
MMYGGSCRPALCSWTRAEHPDLQAEDYRVRRLAIWLSASSERLSKQVLVGGPLVHEAWTITWPVPLPAIAVPESRPCRLLPGPG